MKGPQTIEDSQKPPISQERESKIARVKRMLTGHIRTPLTYDEAKANCKARKRKERQESVSSISQERKVIRSNSEERPNNDHDNKSDIRRVSSHEDFQKTQTLHNANSEEKLDHKSNNQEINADYFIYDDYEHECRRARERFSRPLAQRGRFTPQLKKPKAKQFPKVQNKDKQEQNASKAKPEKDPTPEKTSNEDQKTRTLNNFLQLHQEEKERSPSPVHTPISPSIDLSTLHQQIDGSEPLPSTSNRLEESETISSLSIVSNRLLSSPRNSVIITQRIYLNPDVPQGTNILGKDCLSPVEQRLKQLSKQIKSIKKKIKKHDEEFETKFGYKPSHADKLYDKSVKKLCADLGKLKREQKQLKEDSSSILIASSGDQTDKPKTTAVQLQDTLEEIEKKLSSKRQHAERLSSIEEMTSEELIEEKISVQKALLYLQSIHGRPSTKDDKDLARPLYDRYRALKRMVARLTLTSSNVNELATIHEHETMDFVSQPAQTVEVEQTEKMNPTSTDSDTDTSIGENLHALTLEELVYQQKITCEEKKQLRRSLKEFENEFQMKNGRKLQKDDKVAMESVYTSYKKAKAKLRLIDALIEKQKM